MKKSTFTDLYRAFQDRILALRRSAGLTQRDLAALLGREPSFVARVEQGERRVDAVELYWIVQACGGSPERFASEVMRAFAKLDRARPAKDRGRSP